MKQAITVFKPTALDLALATDPVAVAAHRLVMDAACQNDVAKAALSPQDGGAGIEHTDTGIAKTDVCDSAAIRRSTKAPEDEDAVQSA